MTDKGIFEPDSIESVLSRAFAPVEPPARMYDEVQTRLQDISHSAAEELADWELAAMGDPRNWVRPAVALAAGGAAAGALVVIGLRRRRHDDDAGAVAIKALTDAIGDAAEGARDEIRRAARDFTS